MSQTQNEEGQSQDLASQFEEEATAARTGLIGEFVDFLKDNKKWWLLPLLIVFLLVALLTVLGSSPVAPFIYTLF
jgi:hypothetical protein